MRMTGHAIAFIGLLAALARPAGSAPPRNKSLILENGLRVALVEKRSLPLIAISAAVDVGVKDEPPEANGLLHVLEHCILFRGTERRSGAEVGRDVRRNGAYFNANTGLDTASFDISLPSDRVDFGLANQKEILFDFDISAEELAIEKEVILEELRMVADDPWRRSASLVAQALFPGHPYGRPVTGTEEDIRALTLERLKEFHAAYFVPGNIALAVVGDLPIETMEAKVRAVFGSVPKGPPAQSSRPEKAPLLEKDSEIREEMDVKEAYLTIGFVGPDYNHQDQYAIDLLVEILGRGINPMLNSALRARRDLVQSVSMSYVPLRAGGIVMAVFTLDPKDVRMAKSEALGFLRGARELNFAASDHFGEARTFAYDFLEAARNQVRFSARKGGESSLQMAGSLARHILLGDGRGRDFMEAMGRVSSSDLREAAARYFGKGDSVVVAIVPKKND
jgi:predicted Zn-dependent peptidase